MALAHEPTPDPYCEEDVDAAGAVMAAMAMRPGTGWRTSELCRHLAGRVSILKIIEVIRLAHVSGALERIAPATYRLPHLPPRLTAIQNAARLWGAK